MWRSGDKGASWVQLADYSTDITNIGYNVVVVVQDVIYLILRMSEGSPTQSFYLFITILSLLYIYI